MSTTQTTPTLQAIPYPPGNLLLGNILQIGEAPVINFMEFAKDYGPIFRLKVPGPHPIFVSSFELVDELCDESRFAKNVGRPLQLLRPISGDGLFTAYNDEPNWQKAHNILMPAFSIKAMRNYFDMMLEFAEQLCNKWDRLNADDEVNVPDDMTRLTLDTIALCGFGYRFNSFYQREMHPFVDSMVRGLQESMERINRLALQNHLMFNKQKQYQADITYINEVVDEVIRERKNNPTEASNKKDLLSLMLNGIDKTSGQGLDDVNIRYQVITFLIAGHETTSGLLSFAIYFLLKHPAVLAKAIAEVDSVLGTDLSKKPSYEQINRLSYIKQILFESLRIWPTAPAFAVSPHKDTVIGGTYPVKKEDSIAVLVPSLHRDKQVWGHNANLFNPENFSPDAVKNRPANAFKPFGNGQRACIGRQFAMQEATLVIAMLLQRYQFIDHTDYQLKVKQTLTFKPDNFKIKIRKRPPVSGNAPILAKTPAAVQSPAPKPELSWTADVLKQHNTSLLVLYGSNMGTAEDLAHQIASDAESYGYLSTVAPLDEYVNKLPREGAVLIISASYNGNPPDNAEKFCNWLTENKQTNLLKDVKYGVFGCGHRDWAATYQAVPKLIDTKLAEMGATCIIKRGAGDGADDFFGDFQRWYKPVWATLAKTFNLSQNISTSTKAPLYQIEVVSGSHPNPFVASFKAHPTEILVNKELHNKNGPTPSKRSTRHIELALPAPINYKTGDHLGVITHNSYSLVKRVAARFNFNEHTFVSLHQTSQGKTNFPLKQPIAVFDLLKDYVELQSVATQEQLKLLAKYTACLPEKEKLLALAMLETSATLTDEETATNTLYRAEVLDKRKSLIDLLEEFPACELPFNIYLEQLPALRPRYYSISSSPLYPTPNTKNICSITVGVVDAPALSGRGRYQGVCSNYLATQAVGNTIYTFVRDTKSSFRLPSDPNIPLIMIGPGTGLAPFRGFLQERAALKQQGQAIGESLLFFGCRHPEQDFIYKDELESFVKTGITELITAFSRVPEQPKVYVQQRILEQQDKVWQLLQAGAIIYVCGDASGMAPAVKQAFATLYQQKTGHTAKQAEDYLQTLEVNQRYLTDIWAS